MIETKNYIIERLTIKFLSTIPSHYFSMINNIDLNKYSDRLRTNIDAKQAINYIENNLVFAIHDRRNHLGNIGIHNIDRVNNSCEIGILIFYPGQGIGKECLPKFIDYCHNKERFYRVWLGTIAENKAMIKLAESSGMKHDAILKDAKRLKRYTDVHIYRSLNV